MKNKLKVINLYGGPGAGKSTTRAGLFNIMKLAKYSVEETTEYAKDRLWESNHSMIKDQLMILANQNHRLFRLIGKVEWTITDSPLLLSLCYVKPDYLPKTFNNVIYEVNELYDNYNFFLNRVKPYNQSGRYQTEEEAKKIDILILDILNKSNIKHNIVAADENAPNIILAYIKKF